MSLYDIEVTTETGEAYSLDRYRGKTLLIVNTATKCGLAPQFEELQNLYEKYEEDGFVVLGFPSNQFKQEVDTGLEAAEACQATYGVTFPMHDLVYVNGEEAHPLFKFLKKDSGGFITDAIKWNFTKFLVDKNGTVVNRFGPQEEPSAFEKEIQTLL